MSTSAARSAFGAPFRAVRRLFPDAEIIQDATPEGALYGGAYTEPPTLRQAELVEGSTVRAIRVMTPPAVTFGAFLDGAQQVRILSHCNGVPILLGTVSAAVRVRRNRRLTAWGHRAPEVRRRLYMPFCHLKGVVELSDGAMIEGFEIVDTTTLDKNGEMSRHPGALRAVALERIRRDREHLEQQLAEAWCTREHDPICVDGPIGGSDAVASSVQAVGMIKSHQTLHVEGDALTTVMRLACGERSSVFRVGGRNRTSAWSWYLRVRDPKGHDAMFGLVRVEVSGAIAGSLAESAGDRADRVSSWILAESSPLALPDPRWDTMLYGVRECEEFLRAIST